MNLVEEIRAIMEARRPARERARQAYAQITDDRRIEWLTTTVIGCMGTLLAIPGDTLSNGRVFASVFVILGPQGEVLLALGMIAVAVARTVALSINGIRGRPTSLVRFVTAAAGCSIFASFTWALAWPWMSGDLPAPVLGMLTYAALAVADYTSAMGAARDAAIYGMGHSPRSVSGGHRT